MNNLFSEMVDSMEAAFRDLEERVPRPHLATKEGGIRVYRYQERDIRQALILKLALLQSTLRAARILLLHGHVMEQGILQRVIEDLNEDIAFLVFGVIKNEITDLHQRYLAAFWMEEFVDFSDLAASHQSRPMIPRRKIRAYLSEIGNSVNPSDHSSAARVVNRAYSGFVHGAATNIFDCYGGYPERFHTSGVLGSSRAREYSRDLWNYMFRGLLAHVNACKAFGAEARIGILENDLDRFCKIHEQQVS